MCVARYIVEPHKISVLYFSSPIIITIIARFTIVRIQLYNYAIKWILRDEVT